MCVHLKVKDVKTIEELPKLTVKTLGKRKKQYGEEEEEEQEQEQEEEEEEKGM
jgi:nucleosome binding factor SPN SPT16 subunit